MKNMKKLIKIVLVTSLTLLILSGCQSGKTDYPVDFQVLLEDYQEMEITELEEIYNTSQNPFEKSYAKFFIASLKIQEDETFAEGFSMLQENAEEDVNPMAMVTLGRYYYAGPINELQQDVFEEDMTLAKFYLTAAFEISKYTADAKIESGEFLFAVVSPGALNFLDAYTNPVIENLVDQGRYEDLLRNKSLELIDRHNEIYGTRLKRSVQFR